MTARARDFGPKLVTCIKKLALSREEIGIREGELNRVLNLVGPCFARWQRSVLAAGSAEGSHARQRHMPIEAPA